MKTFKSFFAERCWPGHKPVPGKKPYSPGSCVKEEEINEDLRNWFNPNHPKGNWKRINSKGEAIGPCAREPGEPKPKCMSQAQRDSLSKKERASAVRRKRQQDPNAERQGAPINVKSKVDENMKQLDEKNVPTNPELWSRAIAQAKSKFDVYPSAYANGWASKWYKGKGGGWKSVSESSIVDSAAQFLSEKKIDEVAAWQRKEGKSEAGGLNRKGIASYRAEHPGSKLSMAVTTKPSELKAGSKAANRRKSFCARMGGMKKRLTSAKTANDPDSRINKALRKWNC